MTTREFIMLMESSLRGEVSEAVIQENINYYEGYIREQIAAGRNEQEVLEMLGDPRLIARTIIDTNGGDGSYQTSGRAPMATASIQADITGHLIPTAAPMDVGAITYTT